MYGMIFFSVVLVMKYMKFWCWFTKKRPSLNKIIASEDTVKWKVTARAKFKNLSHRYILMNLFKIINALRNIKNKFSIDIIQHVLLFICAYFPLVRFLLQFFLAAFNRRFNVSTNVFFFFFLISNTNLNF